jgi:ketosteroid isomerase-like protein
MHKTGRLTTIAVAAIVGACSPSPKAQAPVPAPVVNTAAISATIQAGEASWGKEVDARDGEALGAHYAPDVVYMLLDAPPLRSREALSAAMKNAPPNKDISIIFVPKTVDVAASGDLAVSIGRFEYHHLPSAQVVLSGTYLASYRKQPDGAWLVTALSSTRDAPPDQGASKTATTTKSADSKKAR